MPPPLALLLCVVFIVTLLRMDAKHRRVSPGLWIPLIWLLLISSRYVSGWLYAGRAFESPEQYLEGSPVDRNTYVLLIALGVIVLVRRHIRWSRVVASNPPLFLLLLYCGVSVAWSDFPFVSFKRWVKGLGMFAMVLLILSDIDYGEAARTILRRCGYVLIPLSILLIKYYPSLGRLYDPWTGEVAFCGVALSKNQLGGLCLVCAFYFCWDLLARWGQGRFTADKIEVCAHILLVVMTLWLLMLTNSVTAVICLLVGVTVVIGLGLPVVKRNARYVGMFVFVAIFGMVVLESVFGMVEFIVAESGRDMTFTGRVPLWKELLTMGTDPLFGTGYEGFWLGDRASMLWETHWWRPVQAHNGYLEVYLNLGWIGLALMIGVFLWAYRRGRDELLADFDYGRFRIGFLAMLLVFSITEAAFTKLHIMWFAFLITAVNVRPYRRPEAQEESQHGLESDH